MSDTDDDSEVSVVRQPLIPMKKKPKHSNLKGKPNQLEGIPRKGFAFIGNLKKKNTSKEVYKHVKKNSNVQVEMTDIQELKTNSDSKAFKGIFYGIITIFFFGSKPSLGYVLSYFEKKNGVMN